MARYNHFAKNDKSAIMFDDLRIGDSFFLGKYINGRSKKVKAIKTGDLSYVESGDDENKKLFSSENFRVYI